MSFFYKIAIDRVNANYLSGWCFHRLQRRQPVSLQCWQNGQLLAEAKADVFREDLLELKMHPTGRCGFEMELPPRSPDCSGYPLQVVPAGRPGVLIELSPLDGSAREPQNPLSLLKDLYRTWTNNDRQIIFMHIPKTAGTSFNTLASSILPRKRTIAHLELVEPERYDALQRRFRYLSGHLRVGVIKQRFRLDRADVFTIVREPYAQLHSHIKWLIESAGQTDSSFFRINNPVIHGVGLRLAGARYESPEALAGFVETLSPLEAAFLDNMQTRYFLDHQPDRVEADDFLQAVDNLETFRLIGITEDYRAFVEQFFEIYRLGLPKLERRLNRSRSQPLYDVDDPDIRGALAPLVRFDLELYRTIRERQGRV